MSDCIFCTLEPSRIEDESPLFLVIKDLYPVTKGHTLIIPKRHVPSFFDLTSEEQSSFLQILNSQKEKLRLQDNSVTGFNVGINYGEDSGQTVMHCHIHLIPRRKGDMENPRGGVRGVIPEKQSY